MLPPTRWLLAPALLFPLASLPAAVALAEEGERKEETEETEATGEVDEKKGSGGRVIIIEGLDDETTWDVINPWDAE